MDEATANIDYKTDELIQNAIKEVMKESTVITIAHRIKTILNYDRIVVLNYGEVEEYDSPENLISNKNSLFYELYSKSHLQIRNIQYNVENYINLNLIYD